ncbi:hypothetical protein MLD52_08270 [Puniceicoccaceae bacterium K14]|nr:hypothetical protein [Puniceicoccaceae bacterium K14]
MTSQKLCSTRSSLHFVKKFSTFCYLTLALFISQRTLAEYKLANPTEEPDPNTVTVIATGIIDEINDPHKALTNKVVAVGSGFTASVSFKPTNDDFHSSGMYAPMPGSWQVSFGNVEAATSGTTIATHYDETFDDILWIQNTGIGNACKGTPVKPFTEVSGLPALTALTGVSLSFATPNQPTPDTIAGAINEDFLSSFIFQNFYARISFPWQVDSTLADVRGTIVEIIVFQGNTLHFKSKLTQPAAQLLQTQTTLLYPN